MGFLIDFLSHAAIVGFMGGAAITIALQQLKGFLGIKKFTKKTDVISVMHSVFGAAHNGVSYNYLCNSFVQCTFPLLVSIPSIFGLKPAASNYWFLCHKILAVELADNSHWSIILNVFDSC